VNRDEPKFARAHTAPPWIKGSSFWWPPPSKDSKSCRDNL
jgi:hypothetical protein